MEEALHITSSSALDPGEWYGWLREQCPVYEETNSEPHFYVLSRHRDVLGALKDTELWSNRDGPGLHFMGQGVLQTAEGDDHRRQRAVVNPAFSNSAMRSLIPRVSEMAAQLFDRFIEQGEGDWIELFALPFPAMVIAEILGVSKDAFDEFTFASEEILVSFGSGEGDRYLKANQILLGHIETAFKHRLEALEAWDPNSAIDPFNDLVPSDVTGLMAVAHRRGELAYEECPAIGANLLIGGHTTTTNLLSFMVYRLIEQPDLMDRLRSDRSLVEPTVEELLRFDSPAQGLFKTNSRPCEVNGVSIPERSKVQILYASANRDSDVWAAPEEFRIDRDMRELKRHIAFGFGTHHCIGAPLARMEAVQALTAIVDRFAEVELAGELKLVDPFIMHGIERLPIRWATR